MYVEPNDDMQLGVAIRDLLLDEELRQAMGRYGQHRFCTDLAWEKSEKELVALYSELLGAEQFGRVMPSTSGG